MANWIKTVSPANSRIGIQKSARLFLWLMWHVAPKRNDTPLKTRASVTTMKGTSQPEACEKIMKRRPTDCCQQIWRWRETERRNTHITPAKPPKRRAVAEAAQTVLDSMPCGVISLTHWSGCAARGMMKPSCCSC